MNHSDLIKLLVSTAYAALIGYNGEPGIDDDEDRMDMMEAVAESVTKSAVALGIGSEEYIEDLVIDALESI